MRRQNQLLTLKQSQQKNQIKTTFSQFDQQTKAHWELYDQFQNENADTISSMI